MSPRWSVPLCALLLLAAPAGAQKPPAEALASLKAADGLQVEQFAAEPMLINPTSMDIDPKGRVWVAEAVNYRRKNFGRPILRAEGDRIVVLVDKDGDGKADESVVFYQGQDLYGPLGVCVAPNADGKGQRVFVCQSPDILVFDDADGDLKADGPPKKFLTGFGGFDHDHGVHGLNFGPDGKLYFTVGDQGLKGVQAADGKGPVFKSGKEILGGTVFRVNPDGTNLELIAHNFRNNYEACVNSFGEVWLSDNDDDGNQQTRICFVMPGGNYGYFPRGKGESHWHEEQPGIVHKTLRTGFGSPTGITFYEGTLLPEKYRGQLLHCDAGPRELRCFHIKPKGAGYELDKENLLTTTDTWFRPSAVRVAPDGSVFVADWYDSGVGGHGMGDWTRGRVYRVTPKGHVGYKVPEVKLDTKEGVLAALGSPCQATRTLGVIKLNGLEVAPALDTLAGGATSTSPFDVARTTWHLGRILHTMPRDKQPKDASKAFITLLQRADKVTGFSEPLWQSFIVRMFQDAVGYSMADHAPDENSFSIQKGRTRPITAYRESLVQLRKVEAEKAREWVIAYAKYYDGQDITYRAALNIACGTDPARRDAILADFPKHFPTWDDKTADLVWELRPKSMMGKLPALLADAKLTPTQKARVVDILAVSDDPNAGAAVLALLATDADPAVKGRAIDNLKLFLPNKWKALAASPDMRVAVDKLMDDPKNRSTGLELVVAANFAAAADGVVKLVNDDKAPMADRVRAVKTLGKLANPKVVNTLASLAGPNTPGVDPALRLEAVAALGNQVTGQAKDVSSQQALTALQTLLTQGDGDDARKAAVTALSGSNTGTGVLLALKEKGQLPAAVDAVAGQLLRNSPFQGQRNKAMVLFPAAAKLDPKKLVPAELAKRAGNADKGKAVMTASLTGTSQCMKCHMVRGVGGQVGPDLSMVGKKGSVENLFESILQPSKAVADQYVQVQVTTAAGLSVSGLPMGETETTLTLRDANGKDTVIKKDDIETRKALKVSIMPDDIAASLTEGELVDLVAYLVTLQTAALTPDSWFVAGPFDSPGGNSGLDKAFVDEKAPFAVGAKFKTKGGETGWKQIRPGDGGYHDLAALHGNAGKDSVSYLYQEVDSPADQDATVSLGTDDGAKLWVNGTQVFTDASTKAAAPDVHQVPVKLKKGRNAVLLKIANGANPHGFYFALLSAQETKAVAGK